jgi:hypothetical protein
MDDEQTAAIERECRELILAITQHGDHGEADLAVSLFAEDGSWMRGGKLYTGRDELLASYASEPSTQVARHINGGTVVTVEDADHASAVTYYLAFRGQRDSGEPNAPLPLDTPFSLGEWHDTFVRTEDGWRFSSRATRRVFARV